MNTAVAPVEAVGSDVPVSVELALISHTNSGKTTLARTLLARDVGEVRDAPHVTEVAEPYALLESPHGDTLRLWDTPGFGDSARLVKRLRGADNPIGWLLREVWDRHRDRPFWSSQQAVRAARDSSDVLLYLVNAAEPPRDAGYVGSEVEVMRWIGKPVLVLLNQTGPPRPHEHDAAEQQAWRAHFAQLGLPCEVLTLDAFARCWVQEGTLFAAVARHLPEDRRAGFARLQAQWTERSVQRFDACMAALAEHVAAAAHDREPIASAGASTGARVLATLGLRPDEAPRNAATAALGARLDASVRQTIEHMAQLHGLQAAATDAILERVQRVFATQEPVPEARAALLGGVLTGALTGLKADLATGGLTLGGGMLVGAIVGGLGGAGLARGYNRLAGTEQPQLTWPDAFLDGLVRASVLRYLAIAHFGRGRGRYIDSESPPHWHEEVQAELASRSAALHAVWAQARDDAAQAQGANPVQGTHTQLTAQALQPLLRAIAAGVLQRLYPAALPPQLAAIA